MTADLCCCEAERSFVRTPAERLRIPGVVAKEKMNISMRRFACGAFMSKRFYTTGYPVTDMAVELGKEAAKATAKAVASAVTAPKVNIFDLIFLG